MVIKREIYFVATIIIAIGAVLGTYMYFGTNSEEGRQSSLLYGDFQKSAKSKTNQVSLPLPNSTTDHLLGDAKSRLVLIEYVDFMCPYCKKFTPVIGSILSAYKGKVALVYRNFPLPHHDPLATDSAISAECVAKITGNDAYWKFTRALFNDQSNQTRDAKYFGSMAKNAGSDGEKVIKCFQKRETIVKIVDEFNLGLDLGIKGTPTSFLYDTKTGETTLITGSIDEKKLSSYIDQLLAK